MSYSARLLIPLGLALAAFGCNWFAMHSRTAPVSFVRVNADISVGEALLASSLSRVELPAEFGASLRETAVPYEHRGVLYSRLATRDMKSGDIVFWRDASDIGPQLELSNAEIAFPVTIDKAGAVAPLLRVGAWVYFRFHGEESAVSEDVGPFRVVAIGTRFTNDPSVASGASDANVITIGFPAPGLPRGENHRKLEELCDKQALGQAKLLRVMQIATAVQSPKSTP